MSESTFTISFKCNDEVRQEEIFNLFNDIALNPEARQEGHNPESEEAKQHFEKGVVDITGAKPSENITNLIHTKEFCPEGLERRNKAGFTVVYMIGSSTAGFGGWPGYKHLLAMEELLDLLGVDKLKFPLLKEAKSMGSVLEIFDDVYGEKPKSAASKQESAVPAAIRETVHLPLPDNTETVVELTLVPGNFTDKLKLVFDDNQEMGFEIGMITGNMFQEQTISHKSFKISFKTRFYLESEKTTSRYSGHIGIFHVDDNHVLDIEF